jgi:thiol:disulfide interchange protein DsbC
MRVTHREIRIKLFVLILITCAFVPLAHGFGTGAEGCSGDCTACHTVKKEEAAAIVKGLDPASIVESVGPSPVRGLYQVVVTKGNDTAIVYLDFSKKYLIAGRVIDTAYRKDVTEEKLAELRRIDPGRIPLGNALVLGNGNGERKLYVFTDPDCPYCARLHGELAALVKEDPRLAVYILLMPLEMHPDATWKTDAIVCAAKERMDKGLQLLEESFTGRPMAKSGCGTNYGSDGKKLGEELGIAMTPTMVLPDGRVVAGAKSRAEIGKLIDEAEQKVTAAERERRANE